MNTQTVQIRIDEKTKLAAQKTFKMMGMDMSSGVKMFLTQVVKDQCFPFVPNTKKNIAMRKEWDKEVADALKNGKRYTSAREMHEDILGKKEYARYSK
ncbi:hypothetical protein A3C57_03020 [Candidatus Nomurabacteria bacterium RIFCSPHIGHO2_02_FULL_33_12]|nr:MAG: hypothetical protein A3C57_03020 [Candidatus Nomurabacteria bacterium RIFCSPHIGHO2_02_FULL_33_12]